MSIEIRIDSVIANGVSGPEAAAINLIYEVLLNKYSQTAYRFVVVNQIGDDLDEVIVKNGKEIYVNVRIPSPENFGKMTDFEKNKIRLKVLHSGLLRIAQKEQKLDVAILEKIKSEVLKKKFQFRFVRKQFVHSKNKNLIAELVVEPQTQKFDYFIRVTENEYERCRHLIYSGTTSVFYEKELFGVGKWKSPDWFILTGKRYEVSFHMHINECNLEVVNISDYEIPPFYEMFKAGTSNEKRKKARDNYLHSLPPVISAVIRKADN